LKSVSVIIPVYNSKATLGRAVMSVVKEPQVFEILIIDDGSTDGSFQIAEEFSGKYAKIRFLHHPNRENKGPAASRNLGLSHATSDWIQFLDADDELLNGKLAGQLNLISSELALIVGNSIHVFPDGRKHYRKADLDIWKGLIRSKLGDTCANLWNKKYLQEVQGWDENLGSSQEYDMMFRLVSHLPKVVFDNRYSTLIYKTENSISTHPHKKEQRIKNWIALRQRIRVFLIRNKAFGIKHKYNWSGAVGSFCDVNGVEYPSEMNRVCYRIYKTEINIKQKLHQLIKS